MKLRSAVLALSLGLALTGMASAQVISYSPRTGDVWVDTQLGSMNGYYPDRRDYFVDDVVSTFGAPRYLVNDLLTTRNWAPGDVYYACALAYQARRPCSDVARMYESDRGQGWGAVAKRMGIKPGSAQFHAMKGQMGKSNGKYKAYVPGRIDGHPGKSGKGHIDGNGPGKIHYEDNGAGKSDKGKSGKGNADKGNSDKGNGNGKGKNGH